MNAHTRCTRDDWLEHAILIGLHGRTPDMTRQSSATFSLCTIIFVNVSTHVCNGCMRGHARLRAHLCSNTFLGTPTCHGDPLRWIEDAHRTISVKCKNVIIERNFNTLSGAKMCALDSWVRVRAAFTTDWRWVYYGTYIKTALGRCHWAHDWWELLCDGLYSACIHAQNVWTWCLGGCCPRQDGRFGGLDFNLFLIHLFPYVVMAHSSGVSGSVWWCNCGLFIVFNVVMRLART